jgi:hypothetical protein
MEHWAATEEVKDAARAVRRLEDQQAVHEGLMDRGESREYREIPTVSIADAQAAIDRNDPEELSVVVLGVALGEPDAAIAQSFCASLATHFHPNVRGNAVLGLGHIARLHRTLDLPSALPLIRAALTDDDPYVRGHAESAADDVAMYLGVAAR